ncbi:unnamed protein product [Tuber melanosporum]|uniref:(Perigord truffle) hypothetical protein n=1 Tax=Tuber melanosporum (strain Mel28) TaxID=656061 RepID=D5GEW4_TUBMM|nr:uncharacterized protein GSTUM_00006616001 [Tuber melanosporum]CAZ83057.1 unnamed protein product [Tuber melanosporum]
MICHSGLLAVCPLWRGRELGGSALIGQGFSITFSCQAFSRFRHSILGSRHISSNNRRTYHIIISSNYNLLPSRLPLTKPA